MNTQGSGLLVFGESDGRYTDLTARGISKATCQEPAKVRGTAYQVAN